MKLRTALFALAALAALALFGTLFFRFFPTPHVIVLVRHAERADASRDTRLSAAGEERAVRLAETLRDLGLQTIYVTEYQRTQQTAQPLAQQLGLTPVQIGTHRPAKLIKQLQRLQAPALVVGHSDTLPELIKQLGVQEPVVIQPDEFHHLYIVMTHRFGTPTLLRLRY